MWPSKHIDRNARVFRVRVKRIESGQVDEREVVAANAGHAAHALLDGNSRIIGDLLPQSGQAIE
jgi:hypothetical protein